MSSKSLTSKINCGVLAAATLVLLTPYNVRAEATHSGTFELGGGGGGSAFANRSGKSQTVFITVCVEPSQPSPSVQVRVAPSGEEPFHLLAVGAGMCEGASVKLKNLSQLEIVGVEGISKGSYTVSVDLP